MKIWRCENCCKLYPYASLLETHQRSSGHTIFTLLELEIRSKKTFDRKGKT